MNTHRHHHHSRPLCRLVRFVSSCSGVLASRHLARCDDCRAYFVAEAKLEGSLRRAARQTTIDVPPGLEDRILESIPYPRPTARRAGTGRHLPRIFALVGVAAAAVAVVLLYRSPDVTTPIVENQPDAIAPPAIVPVRTVDTLDVWRQRIVNLNPANPLELEIDAVYADTRSALRFLALNFLTSEPEILVPPEQRRT